MTLDEIFEEARKADEGIPFEQRERKESVERDPLTGGTMTVVTIGRTFMMLIPHQAIQMTPEEVERAKTIGECYKEWKSGDAAEGTQFITIPKP